MSILRFNASSRVNANAFDTKRHDNAFRAVTRVKIDDTRFRVLFSFASIVVFVIRSRVVLALFAFIHMIAVSYEYSCDTVVI